MTRRVFFSFHYADVMRVQQIRQMGSFVGKQVVRFDDAVAYEAAKKEGDAAIKHWIDRQLVGTSVTVVLIGTDTWKRPYVKYEIEESYKCGNGLLGIHINGLRDVNRRTKLRGDNPFAFVTTPKKHKEPGLSNLFGSPVAPTFPLNSELQLWSARSVVQMSTLASFANIYPHEWATDTYTIIQNNIGDWIESAARDVGR